MQRSRYPDRSDHSTTETHHCCSIPLLCICFSKQSLFFILLLFSPTLCFFWGAPTDINRTAFWELTCCWPEVHQVMHPDSLLAPAYWNIFHMSLPKDNFFFRICNPAPLISSFQIDFTANRILSASDKSLLLPDKKLTSSYLLKSPTCKLYDLSNYTLYKR
jgi:hypothetical protein